MKLVPAFTVLLMSLHLAFATDVAYSTNSEALVRDKLFQRFLVESEQLKKQLNLSPDAHDDSYTNGMRLIFDGMVVHPSFGYRWDEVPAPTMTGSNAMAAIDEFIATNGWDMQKDGIVFDSVSAADKSKVIRGLPWTAIHGREFPAVTHDGILYVFFTGWHHNNQGVAYNPKTNAFLRSIFAFKPIEQHWYCWATDDSYDPGDRDERVPQQYEGTKGKSAEPNAAPSSINIQMSAPHTNKDKNVVELLANGAEFTVHDLSRFGDVEKVKTLLKTNPELAFSKDFKGNTPLHYAAERGHKDLAELLLANKADVNAMSERGRTPLYEAISYGHKEMMELLLANKADINARTEDGATPLSAAALMNNKEAVKYLLANGADVNARDNDGETPLFNAADNGYMEVAKLLLDNKAEVNVRDNKGLTPLRHAVDYGYKDVAKLLRQHGGHE